MTEHHHPVTDIPGTDISRLMRPGTEKHQSMDGFDDDYVDIVDYIVRCTHKIWEERGVGLIYTHYAHNVAIHTTDGLTYGRDKVIADSLRTMNAFADLRLYADDVIWSGNDRDGFHTSHRIVWVGHNTGHSIYGPPTGRRVVRYGIAHCFVKQNRIIEEWIARDERALVRQLGLDEHTLAREMAARDAELGIKHSPEHVGEAERLQGQNVPASLSVTTEAFDAAAFVRRVAHEVWNWRMVSAVEQYYAPNYTAHVASATELYGLGDLKSHVISFLATFSDLMLSADHVCVLGNDHAGYRAALRWTMVGTHDGPARYGTPSGHRVRLMGISHFLIQNERIVREWTLFDEFALLKQLYSPSLVV